MLFILLINIVFKYELQTQFEIFVRFRHDSVVTDEINYDLLMTADGIQSGRISCPRLLGDCLLANSKTKETIPPAVQKVYSCTS